MFIFEKSNITKFNLRVMSKCRRILKKREKCTNPLNEKLARMTPEERRDYWINEFIPSRARLEVSTICQLRCTGCGFQKGGDDNLDRGFLTFENFKRFCEMNPFIREIDISNFGEPFLNPYLVDMMYFAQEKGVSLTCFNGSNFNTVSDEQIRALVDTEFQIITLSIDGASQKTYSQYRVGGDFNQVIENIRKLQAYKKEKGRSYPKLRWQYILMEHNELEIGQAKKLAKELGIPITFKRNWDKNYKPTHRGYLIKETKRLLLTEEEYISVLKVSPFDFLCEQLFIRPQINWDGRLLGCCEIKYATFDSNVFEVGLVEAIRSPKYRAAKECLMTVHPEKERYASQACFHCERRQLREKAGIAFEPMVDGW